MKRNVKIFWLKETLKIFSFLSDHNVQNLFSYLNVVITKNIISIFNKENNDDNHKGN